MNNARWMARQLEYATFLIVHRRKVPAVLGKALLWLCAAGLFCQLIGFLGALAK
jgi:hypothetical protein